MISTITLAALTTCVFAQPASRRIAIESGDALEFVHLVPKSVDYKGQKALKVDGVPCEAKKISVEPLKYPLSRYLFMVLPGDGSTSPPALTKFIDWMRLSPLAGEVISKAGGVPAFNKKK